MLHVAVLFASVLSSAPLSALSLQDADSQQRLGATAELRPASLTESPLQRPFIRSVVHRAHHLFHWLGWCDDPTTPKERLEKQFSAVLGKDTVDEIFQQDTGGATPGGNAFHHLVKQSQQHMQEAADRMRADTDEQQQVQQPPVHSSPRRSPEAGTSEQQAHPDGPSGRDLWRTTCRTLLEPKTPFRGSEANIRKLPHHCLRFVMKDSISECTRIGSETTETCKAVTRFKLLTQVAFLPFPPEEGPGAPCDNMVEYVQGAEVPPRPAEQLEMILAAMIDLCKADSSCAKQRQVDIGNFVYGVLRDDWGVTYNGGKYGGGVRVKDEDTAVFNHIAELGKKHLSPASAYHIAELGKKHLSQASAYGEAILVRDTEGEGLNCVSDYLGPALSIAEALRKNAVRSHMGVVALEAVTGFYKKAVGGETACEEGKEAMAACQSFERDFITKVVPALWSPEPTREVKLPEQFRAGWAAEKAELIRQREAQAQQTATPVSSSPQSYEDSLSDDDTATWFDMGSD